MKQRALIKYYNHHYSDSEISEEAQSASSRSTSTAGRRLQCQLQETDRQAGRDTLSLGIIPSAVMKKGGE